MGRPPGRAHDRPVLLALVLASATILVAVVLLLPTISVRWRPPELRQPDEWRFSHRLEPVDGMAVSRRILTPDHELTIVRSDDDVAQCTVDLSRGPADPGPHGSRVWIHGWRASYVDDPSRDPSLTWTYAPRAWVTVTCTRSAVSRSTQLEVARAVRFADARIRLPFTLDTLPEGYRIFSVDEDTGSGTDVVSLGLQPVDRASIPSVVVSYGGSGTAYRCLEPTAGAAQRICLSTRWSAEEAPGASAVVQRSLDRVAERIVPAPDPTDPTTWFDAIDLPR
jgi:hypothetical protein